MKEMFKQIPQTTKKSLTPKKVQKIMIDIGGGWYMEKSSKGLPPLRRTKLSKKSQEPIYLKLHGSRVEYFITHARTDRYNLMCYLVDNDKLQSDYKDYESSIGDMSIPDNATTKSLEAVGATINFNDIWLTLFCENYEARCAAYINAMK